MKALVPLLAAVAIEAGAARAAQAHHSFAAEYDDQKPLKITGTLTKVEWMNPHIWYYVDVKNPDGTVTTWAISGGAPGQSMRRGITKDLLVLGSEVNVEGFTAKDGTQYMPDEFLLVEQQRRMQATQEQPNREAA